MMRYYLKGYSPKSKTAILLRTLITLLPVCGIIGLGLNIHWDSIDLNRNYYPIWINCILLPFIFSFHRSEIIIDENLQTYRFVHFLWGIRFTQPYTLDKYRNVEIVNKKKGEVKLNLKNGSASYFYMDAPEVFAERVNGLLQKNFNNDHDR
ncbi:hypothetical protein [Porphyromonas macacae]|uniref:hypothetical protein n=1 Tax=Porphyromonas macacae TaxID=28115 RepID=UPI000B122A08|nr:hypothetical protein [Porphyromonas macacae]